MNLGENEREQREGIKIKNREKERQIEENRRENKFIILCSNCVDIVSHLLLFYSACLPVFFFIYFIVYFTPSLSALCVSRNRSAVSLHYIVQECVVIFLLKNRKEKFYFAFSAQCSHIFCVFLLSFFPSILSTAVRA